MVYSHNASTRAYIKAVALCALAIASAPSTVAADGSAACEVSSTDKSFGIRVMDDVGCATGGLGCYNDHCRYCKILENPKSTAFESCSSFGGNFPTMAAPTLTTGPCEVSEGDAAVGIAVVTDTECLYGGLGCFGDHCRFCKVEETAQSTVFLDCNGFNTTTLVTEPTPATSAPTSTVAVTTAPVDSCDLKVSDGDASVGINIVSDSTCSAGGVGCIDEVCRFCKTATTVQSAAFVDCATVAGVTETPTEAPIAATEAPTAAPTTAAPSASTDSSAVGPCELVAAESDIKAGINIVTDDSCATGGIGCVNSVCRYCRVVYTIHSVAFEDCGSIGNGISTTDAPATTVTDAPTTAVTNGPTCTTVVSSGDAAVGINIVSDASCSTGGVGCLDDVCRFCKVLDTEQSSAYLNCTSFGDYIASTTGTAATLPVTTAAPVTTEAPAVTEAPTATPAATEAPTGTCTQVVSEGDAAVGINITTDASCANGGVGCIDAVCRFCKVTESDKSAAFVDCPSA